MNARGEYSIETVVGWKQIWDAEQACAPKPADKPCYRITGPGEFTAIGWDRNTDPERMLREFLLDFFAARKAKIDTVRSVVSFDYAHLAE